MSVVIRPAKTADVKTIRAIVDTYAVERKLLSKETVTLFESVQEFVVAESGGEVVGCGALHVLWEDIAEVRTVAVVEQMHGKGVGHLILEKYFQARLSRETYFLNSCFAIEIFHRRFKKNNQTARRYLA